MSHRWLNEHYATLGTQFELFELFAKIRKFEQLEFFGPRINRPHEGKSFSKKNRDVTSHNSRKYFREWLRESLRSGNSHSFPLLIVTPMGGDRSTPFGWSNEFFPAKNKHFSSKDSSATVLRMNNKFMKCMHLEYPNVLKQKFPTFGTVITVPCSHHTAARGHSERIITYVLKVESIFKTANFTTASTCIWDYGYHAQAQTRDLLLSKSVAAICDIGVKYSQVEP